MDSNNFNYSIDSNDPIHLIDYIVKIDSSEFNYSTITIATIDSIVSIDSINYIVNMVTVDSIEPHKL